MASYTSTGSGNWSNPATWGGSGPPTDGDSVTVAASHTVVYDAAINSSGLAGLTLNGVLSFAPSTRTHLKMAAAITLGEAGELRIGTAASPIQAPPDATPEMATLELQGNEITSANGVLSVYGECRDGRDSLAQAQEPGDNTLALVQGFSLRAGDVIAVSQAAAGRLTSNTAYTVQSYNAETKVATLTTTLGRAVAAGCSVILLSRNIAILGNGTSAKGAFNGFANTPTLAGARFSDLAYGACPGRTGWTFEYCTFENCVSYGAGRSAVRPTLNYCTALNGSLAHGIAPQISQSTSHNSSSNMGGIFSAATQGKAYAARAYNSTYGVLNDAGSQYADCVFAYCADGVQGASGTTFSGCTFTGNSRDLRALGGYQVVGCSLYGSSLGAATEFSGYNTATVSGRNVYSESVNHDQTNGDFKAWMLGGIVVTVSDVKRPGRERSYKHTLESASHPVFSIWAHVVEPGQTLTLSAWAYKTTSLAYLPRVWIIDPTRNPIADPTNCTPLAEDIMADINGEWDALEVSWTNTDAGPVEVWFVTVALGASGDVHFDFAEAETAGPSGLPATSLLGGVLQCA